MTNNPRKCEVIEGYGIEIVERVPVVSAPTGENIGYLRAKQEKLGHFLGLGDGEESSIAEPAVYERIGIGYRGARRPDPRIAARITAGTRQRASHRQRRRRYRQLRTGRS